MAVKTAQNPSDTPADALWQASGHKPEESQLAAFVFYVEKHYGQSFPRPFDKTCYKALHRWSVENKEDFWSAAWDFCGVIGEKGDVTLEVIDKPPYARFYPQGKISYAENVLQYWIDHPTENALIYRHQDDASEIWTGKKLCEEVSRWEQLLKAQGVKEGECIAINMPYTPDHLAIRLAAANLGAPVVKAGTEMKINALLKRFKQAEPVLLIAPNGYRFKDKNIDYRASIKEIQGGLPSLRNTLVLPYDGQGAAGIAQAEDAFVLKDQYAPKALSFVRRDFNYPLAYLFSSGSTGTPKGFIHGQGNLILKHMAEHQLNLDMRAGDVYFQNSSITWMMADYLDSAPASGTCAMLYDGRHDYPGPAVQLKFAADHGCTHLGTSAGLIKTTWMAPGIDVTGDLDLSRLRYIIYTGGALHDKGFAYLHDHVAPDSAIWGVSGGTDLCGCFVGGNPFADTVAGQIAGPMLGMDVHAWDEDGNDVPEGEKGELVCLGAFPSMPTGFLNDPDGKRYEKEYFLTYKGHTLGPVWAHGDKMAFVDGLALVIYGRSGMTHNKHDLRSEPYDIYQELDAAAFPAAAAIREKASVNFFHPENGDNLIVMFLAMTDGADAVPQELQDVIKARIAKNIGGHAVPDHIIAVPCLPKTPNGKDVEIPLAKVLGGEEIDDPELYTGMDCHGCEVPGKGLIDLFAKHGENLRVQYATKLGNGHTPEPS